MDIDFDDPHKKAMAELVISVAEKNGVRIASTGIDETITGGRLLGVCGES
ncbi:hypothetical protein H5895_15715 [Klebsiella pneumoniae]|nr:hypothetical protein [Klebsiella pneumoniae]HDG7815769.1 hypothetical protein [Klebsiella quasipneumoniae]MCB2979165.1 hypothetical protein [Klebsiella pneumoniae]MCB3088941.1 hypothetical protein [Klebsiella pneumoniae]MCB3100211.1 hypothetical protein [Klebsiella pneumoniae]MCB3131247.1 hypothetical protein [Klebsiella pneumoniae]